MQNSTDLTQAIQALERELTKAAQDMQQKEKNLNDTRSKSVSLGQEIKSSEDQIRQKEQEILKLKQDIDIKKREITANDKLGNTVQAEIQCLKLEHTQKNNQVSGLMQEQKNHPLENRY